MQPLDVRGITADMPHRHQERRLPDEPIERRLLLDQCTQFCVAFVLRTLEETRFGYAPAERAPARQRNHPEPDIAMFRMGRDADLVAVRGAGRNAVAYMREDGRARGHARRCFEIQKARQDTAEAACIEYKTGLYAIRNAGFIDHVK